MLGYCPNRGPKFLKIIARTNSSVTSIAFGFWIPWDRKKDKNRSSTKKSTSFCQKHQKLSLNFLCYWMIWMLFRSLLDRAGILIWTYLNSRSCGKFGPMLKGERSKHFFPCFSLFAAFWISCTKTERNHPDPGMQWWKAALTPPTIRCSASCFCLHGFRGYLGSLRGTWPGTGLQCSGGAQGLQGQSAEVAPRQGRQLGGGAQALSGSYRCIWSWDFGGLTQISDVFFPCLN